MTAPDFAKEARDLAANPYSADEQRVADYLAEVAFGGGDDPIGYIITAHRWMWLVSIPNAKEAGEAAGRRAGRAEAAEIARAEADRCGKKRAVTAKDDASHYLWSQQTATRIADAILSASTTPARKDGMAEYLEKFERSPYRDPGGAHGG